VVAHLKTVPDDRRRGVVHRLAQGLLDATGALPLRRQITSEQIRTYMDGAGTLGNHTWDHPCLDRCSAAAASEQVTRAHDDLARRFGVTPTLFAYPNGNPSRAAEESLAELGYNVGLLFDHAITRRTGPPLRASRLRVGDHNSRARFRAIVAGTHPALLRLRRHFAATTES
jgi:peptidoglycan/xylan/chitin deacetylase (PgdA/CDA1 family)